MKRITVATFFGLVAGAICATGGVLGGIVEFTAASLFWVFLNRAVMGFAIGASGLRLHWALNGIVMGLVIGSVFSFSLYLNRGQVTLPVLNALVNGLFGLMIEFFTTIVFRAPSAAAPRRIEKAVFA